MSLPPDGSAATTAPFSGRNILITGATGGLGAALSEALATRGATIVLLGKNIAKLESLYDHLESLSAPQAAIYPLDLTGSSPTEFAELASIVEKELGGLHALLHCAGDMGPLSPLELQTSGALAKTLATNLQGPMLLTQACLPLLKAQASSHLGFTLNTNYQAYYGGYALANGAMHALFELCTKELENSSVYTFAVRPPPMRTAMRRQAYPAESIDTLMPPEQCIDAYIRALDCDSRDNH